MSGCWTPVHSYLNPSDARGINLSFKDSEAISVLFTCLVVVSGISSGQLCDEAVEYSCDFWLSCFILNLLKHNCVTVQATHG